MMRSVNVTVIGSLVVISTGIPLSPALPEALPTLTVVSGRQTDVVVVEGVLDDDELVGRVDVDDVVTDVDDVVTDVVGSDVVEEEDAVLVVEIVDEEEVGVDDVVLVVEAVDEEELEEELDVDDVVDEVVEDVEVVEVVEGGSLMEKVAAISRPGSETSVIRTSVRLPA
jgi:hypothetical protein